MRWFGSRGRRRFISLHAFLFTFAIFTGLGLLVLTLRSVDPSTTDFTLSAAGTIVDDDDSSSSSVEQLGGGGGGGADDLLHNISRSGETSPCATVEEMGEPFTNLGNNNHQMESLRVRNLIHHHFALQGASRVRGLPPDQFCAQGFVLGKASEAGFGNEMYKILTAAALSIMLNRSLIIGQTRGKFPFGDYISYTNASFTLKEVKHLWRQNECTKRFGRLLIMRTDDFEKPVETNVLCSNWRHWKQPIIWFEGTTDAVAAQFFLKNVHSEMSYAASDLFGDPGSLQSRPNVFGELIRVIISPSVNVQEAVNWVLGGGADPDIVLHMRMLMNRSVRAVQAALNCIKKAMLTYQHHVAKPRVVLVSDTPSLIKDITPLLLDSSEVLHFDYEMFEGNISSRKVNGAHQLEFRAKDWGPAPRWVAFVDFFLASRARHAVVSGAHRRVGTTYAQLIAALAAANQLGENSNSSTASSFSFLSSFQSNLLSEGLRNQVGWGHVWNRFAGSLSCRHQSTQCAFTPLLPPGWWDGDWQSPIPRDVRRLEAFGVQLTDSGQVNESQLQSFCKTRKEVVKTIPICQVSSC